MKKTKSKKLLTVLLSLCTLLSLSPMTAFAAEPTVIDRVDVTYEELKYNAGEAPRKMAQITAEDAHYTIYDECIAEMKVVEERPGEPDIIAHTGRYWHSNPIEMARIDSDKQITNMEAGNNYLYSIVLQPESSQYKFDGDITNVYANNYNLGTPTGGNLRMVDSGFRIEYTPPLSVYVTGDSEEQTVTSATVENAKFNYQPGDAPQATAQVTAADAEKYEIDYECWQQFENNEPVAAWYSDNGTHGSLPKITEFESGKKYVYFLMLKPKNGYSFNNEVAVTVNGESVKSSLLGDYLYLPAVKTITPTKQNTVITSAAVENVKLDYKDGEVPRTTATTAATDRDKYDILYECWGKLEKTDEYTTESVAYWYSDEDYCPSGYADLTSFDKDGKYEYSVRLKAKDGYIFSDSISADDITINGKSLPEGSFAMTLDDNRTCVVTYGMNMRTIRPLDTVKLYGATTEFYIDSGSAYSDVAYEKWEDKDDRSIGINSDESLNGGYSQLVDSFKYGKTYIYGVAFNIADLGLEEGYRFDTNTKLCINDEEVTLKPEQVQVSDDGMTVRFNDILSMTPEAPWQKIDLVEIDGATIDFKAGDKPVFTGTVPENSPNVLPQCEFWEGDDGSGVNSYWFWDQNYKNHIDAFESGKTYTYGVYVKAAHGYYFTQDTKLKINGKFYAYHLPEGDPELDNPDFMATLWAITDLTITPEASVPHNHNYGTEWKYDETNHWHECECGNKTDITVHTFKQIIDKEATATEKGSKHEECTVCGYKKAAVDIPATGVGISSDDEANKPTNTVSSEISSADQTNKPINTASPKTGNTDNMILWIVLLVIGGGAFITATAVDKKKK